MTSYKVFTNNGSTEFSASWQLEGEVEAVGPEQAIERMLLDKYDDDDLPREAAAVPVRNWTQGQTSVKRSVRLKLNDLPVEAPRTVAAGSTSAA